MAIPILTINLVDIQINKTIPGITDFYNHEVLALILKNEKEFLKKNLSITLFHNQEVKYPGIQFTLYCGAASFTAFGHKETDALMLWYRIFRKEHKIKNGNEVIISETYNPILTNNYINYRTVNLLLKKEIGLEVKEIKSSFAVRDRLEKYLYGNIRAFLENIAGMEFSDEDFISVKVNNYDKKGFKPTYHGGKLMAYGIDFAVNVYLPQTLRLGQAVSLGYGDIKHV